MDWARARTTAWISSRLQRRATGASINGSSVSWTPSRLRLRRRHRPLRDVRIRSPERDGRPRRALACTASTTARYHRRVNLAVNPPVLPMLAKRVGELPPGEGWIFEPKWDGFRTLVFRDGDEIFIQSRDEKPLNRYFPELIAPLKAQLPERCVLDGEIVIARDEGLDFEALQLRLHPAESRVKVLAGTMPASVVFFDLLCENDRDLCTTPFRERRSRLESLLAGAEPPLHLTPATRDRDTAADWFRRFEGAGLDGVVAKSERGTYEPNKRVMLKVKHARECDCVVAGFRWRKRGGKTAVGSLLRGLYDGESFEHVGVCASFTDVKRQELVTFLDPYRVNALDGHPWRAWAEEQTPDESEAQR